MEYDQNTNEFKIRDKDLKSSDDKNSKDLSVAHIISCKSAMELTKDLNMRRGI